MASRSAYCRHPNVGAVTAIVEEGAAPAAKGAEAGRASEEREREEERARRRAEIEAKEREEREREERARERAEEEENRRKEADAAKNAPAEKPAAAARDVADPAAAQAADHHITEESASSPPGRFATRRADGGAVPDGYRGVRGDRPVCSEAPGIVCR